MADGIIKELVATFSVAKGTTFGNNDPAILVGNQSPYDIEVIIHRIIPPLPPPRCDSSVSDDNYDEQTYISCVLPDGHSLQHQGTIGDTAVYWN